LITIYHITRCHIPEESKSVLFCPEDGGNRSPSNIDSDLRTTRRHIPEYSRRILFYHEYRSKKFLRNFGNDEKITRLTSQKTVEEYFSTLSIEAADSSETSVTM
jgi:hypothetical protein